MKKGNKTLLLPLLLLSMMSRLITIAQTSDDISKYTDFLPPPPNASAITKYGFISLNKNTGAPNISIPLFSVKGNKLATNIALSYNSTGIKVDELASRAGMGWVLNMGGVITRTVRNIADEKRPRRGSPWNTIGFNWSTVNYISPLTDDINATGYDSEPDLFSFNFNGYSGSFVLDDNMSVVQLSRSDIKIAYDFSSSDWNFKLITPDGITYYFGGSTATEKTKRTSTCGKSFDTFLPNAWYLKKTVHPNGETIAYTYNNHTYSYETGVSQTMYWVNPLPLHSCDPTTVCPTPPDNTCVNTVTTEGVLLKSITATGRSKVNVYYTSRPDYLDSLVSNIELVDLQTNTVRNSFQLTYQTITANTGFENESGYGTRQTPFLVSLRERPIDTGLEKVHRFSYIDPAGRAPRLSFSQDHWGYFNGVYNQSLVPKPDDKIVGGSPLMITRFPFAKANREPDPVYAMKGMLSKIMYPTGGMDSILYEGNQVYKVKEISTKHRLMSSITGAGFKNTLSDTVYFGTDKLQYLDLLINCIDNTGNGSFDSLHNKGYVEINDVNADTLVYASLLVPGTISHVFPQVSVGGSYRLILSANGAAVKTVAVLDYQPVTTQVMQNTTVGGLRVDKVLTGNSGEKPIIRKYYYGTMDSLTRSSLAPTEDPLYIKSNAKVSFCNPPGFHTVPDPGSLISCATTYIYSNSLNTMYDYQSSVTSYASVVESIGEHFEGGAVASDFWVVRDSAATVLMGAAFANATKTNSSNALNGKPKEEKVYRKMGNGSLVPVKKTSYTYKLDPRGVKTVYGYMLNQRISQNPYFNLSTFDTTGTLASIFLIDDNTNWAQALLVGVDLVRYDIKANWVYTDSTKEILYDENGQTPITNLTRYFYDTSAHSQLTRTETTNSKGEQLKTVIQYPIDFSGQAIYDTMLARNITATVIGTTTYKNDAELSRVKTNYADWGYGNIAPASVQKSLYGNALVSEGSIDLYDSAGNVLQYTAKDGVVNSVLWGYQYTYPVAKIAGATYAQAAAALPISTEQLQNLDGTVLADALNVMRSSLTGAMVTSYLYKPLTGVTAMTDANNKKNTFVYDAFDRVVHIRDQDSNLVKKFEYGYAGPDTTPMATVYYNTMTGQNFNCQTCITGYTALSIQYQVAEGKYYSIVSQYQADSLAAADIASNGQAYVNNLALCLKQVMHSYHNAAASGSFVKNNCAAGGTGSTVTYTVAAGTYASTVSQADADNLAQADVNANGQTYANSNGNCTFYSVQKSGSFQKNNCAAGGTGSTVTYTVAAGTYTSNSSQADADNQAQANVNANGQTYANSNGNCTFYSVQKSGSFQKNNCTAGGTGSTVTYTVAAGTYTSNSSQADADNQAQANVNANGQTYANSNGNCTFYSVQKSGSFQKNNCAAGGTGSTVTYTVAAGTYTSNSSQADADNQAQANVNANGQTYANNNGYCTFYNIMKSGTFQKNNCGAGGTGSYVTYTVASGAYSSNSSQADADNQAQADVNANGQAFANANGYCTFYSVQKSGSFQKSNCAAGGTGSYVTYTVAAGAHISHSSQVDADNQAQADVDANGGTYANNNGYCTFYNVQKSGTYQKNNCASGGTGSYVTYTVAAGSYSSNSSQADADNQAQNNVYANGQAYANANGYCTFYSTAKSGSFLKNNCASGGYGSTVLYTVDAGMYNSTSSQADADNQAQNDVNANGQAYANSHGYCTFYSVQQSASFQKTDCPSGGTGSWVTRTIGAGSFSSNSSQADADNQAIAYVNATGPANANALGYCTFYSAQKLGSFQKNNCASGGTGSYVTYIVGYAAYTSNISQADADSKAQNDVDANGQAYANANGYCTFYNTARSQSFQKNDCGDYSVGSWVTYYVSAGIYSSYSSQADADNQAQANIDAYGQGYANTYGSCTYYNYAISQSFTKSCPAGYVGSSVTYTVAAWSYSSSTSQHDAQILAQGEMNTNGQANANANGTCTYVCTSGNCSGIDKKCVWNNCETGVKVYTDSEWLGPRYFRCTYHYEWSDGSWSEDYTEDRTSSCL